jgi:preprotein translocase subunit YajC
MKLSERWKDYKVVTTTGIHGKIIEMGETTIVIDLEGQEK